MDDRGTAFENSRLGGGLGLHPHRTDRTTLRKLVVGFFRCMSCRGGSQLLQPYFSGLLRHGHVFDYRPRFRFLFLVGRIKERIVGYLVAAAVTLYLSRFFYSSTQAITCAMCLVFMFYRLGISLLDIGFFFRSSIQASTDEPLPFQVKPKSSIDFVTVLSSIPSFRFTCLSVILIGWVLFAESWSSGKVIEDHALRFWFGLSVPFVIYGISCYGRILGEALSKSFSVAISIVMGAIMSIPASVALLLLFIGIVFDYGPYSGTWAKLTGKLQSYSSDRVAGATVGGTSGHTLNFLDVKSTTKE